MVVTVTRRLLHNVCCTSCILVYLNKRKFATEVAISKKSRSPVYWFIPLQATAVPGYSSTHEDHHSEVETIFFCNVSFFVIELKWASVRCLKRGNWAAFLLFPAAINGRVTGSPARLWGQATLTWLVLSSRPATFQILISTKQNT